MLDDFEDTLPDEGPPLQSPMEQLFSEDGLRKALSIFETVSSVWQNVTAERAQSFLNQAADESTTTAASKALLTREGTRFLQWPLNNCTSDIPNKTSIPF